MWGNMMGWGGGAMFGIGHLLWWGVLILVIVVSVRWLVRSEGAGEVAQEVSEGSSSSFHGAAGRLPTIWK